MGDDELPPLDADPGEIDDYWTEDTTITVSRYVKQQLNESRQGRPWGEYLQQLRRESDDPLTLTDADQIAEVLAEQLDAIGNGASMTADPAVDGEAVAEEIANRLDDLEARLPRKVAEEVHRQR